MVEFNNLEIREDILQNIMFLGLTEMTTIQEMVIPEAVKGKDIIGQAKTGTGKTFSFAIPIIEKIKTDQKNTQALVLTPTRELALQVSKEFEKLAGSSIQVAEVYGGASINPQIEKLRKGSHIVVGTPGRIIDHIKRKTLKLDNVQTLVLDEADRMLDMGFIIDIEWIIKNLPRKRQTLLFSATMPNDIRRLGEKYMVDASFIQANTDDEELTIGDVEQFYVEIDQKKKMDAFFKVVDEDNPEKSLIFCKTKKWVESLYGILKKRGYKVDRIHGDMTQNAREGAVKRLKKGKIKFLICTDVMARGLDIDDITHVFNYDLPQEPMTYVHRIGRTGRAGKKGTSISFVIPEEIRDLWLVEHKARTKIAERKISI